MLLHANQLLLAIQLFHRISTHRILLLALWGLLGDWCSRKVCLSVWNLLLRLLWEQSRVGFYELGRLLDFSACWRLTKWVLPWWLSGYFQGWRFILMQLLVGFWCLPFYLDWGRISRWSYWRGLLWFKTWYLLLLPHLLLMPEHEVFWFSPRFVSLINWQILCNFIDDWRSILLLASLNHSRDLLVNFLHEFCHFILRDRCRWLRSQSLLLGDCLLSQLFPEECIGVSSLALTLNECFALNLALKFERVYGMVLFIDGWAVQYWIDKFGFYILASGRGCGCMLRVWLLRSVYVYHTRRQRLKTSSWWCSRLSMHNFSCGEFSQFCLWENPFWFLANWGLLLHFRHEFLLPLPF